jgi:predicted XRE-type DNA-binding protein
MRKVSPNVTEGSDNLFRDLGLPDPEERLFKTKLASLVLKTIQERGLWNKRKEVEKLLKLSQSKVSLLFNAKLDAFSVEKLMIFMIALGQNMNVSFDRAGKGRRGEIRVEG